MKIRDEIPADAPLLDRMITESFLTARVASGREAEVVRRLRADGALWLSLVAEEAGVILGHIAVSPSSVGGQAGWALIGPLAVAPLHQGQGIGSALMGAALDRLRGQAPGVVLVGNPDYYRRFGFRPWPGLFQQGVPPEVTLALPLAPGITPTGEHRCHPALSI